MTGIPSKIVSFVIQKIFSLLEHLSGLFKKPKTSSTKCCCKCGSEPQPPPYTGEDVLSGASVIPSCNPDKRSRDLSSKSSYRKPWTSNESRSSWRSPRLSADLHTNRAHIYRCGNNSKPRPQERRTGSYRRFSDYWRRLCGMLLKQINPQRNSRPNEPQDLLAKSELSQNADSAAEDAGPRQSYSQIPARSYWRSSQSPTSLLYTNLSSRAPAQGEGIGFFSPTSLCSTKSCSCQCSSPRLQSGTPTKT